MNARRLIPANVKNVASKAAGGVKEATHHAGTALDWGRKQHARVKPHLPKADEIEAWVRANAEAYRWRENPKSASPEHLEEILTQIVSAIRQTSDRRARLFVNAIAGKLGCAVTVGSISGLVTSFGVASTGTAIATLSGAAATTAKLYWIGNLVGLGVAGGGILLTAGGLGAGVVAGVWRKRKILGKPRSEDDLQDHEKAILVACITLINAVQLQRESGQEPSPAEMRVFAEQALIPLVNQINQHWDDASLKANNKSECRPFNRTLVYRQRHKLDRCRTELGRIALSAMAATNGR